MSLVKLERASSFQIPVEPRDGTEDQKRYYRELTAYLKLLTTSLQLPDTTKGVDQILFHDGSGKKITWVSLPAFNFKDFYTDVSSTGTTETDLMSFTAPANTFRSNGDKLEFTFGGSFVNSTSTKRIRIYFAGSLVFDSTALAISAASAWQVFGLGIKESSSNVRFSISLVVSGASLASLTSYTKLTGLTLTGTNILKLTGTSAGIGSANGDILGTLGKIQKFSAA